MSNSSIPASQHPSMPRDIRAVMVDDKHTRRTRDGVREANGDGIPTASARKGQINRALSGCTTEAQRLAALRGLADRRTEAPPTLTPDAAYTPTQAALKGVLTLIKDDPRVILFDLLAKRRDQWCPAMLDDHVIVESIDPTACTVYLGIEDSTAKFLAQRYLKQMQADIRRVTKRRINAVRFVATNRGRAAVDASDQSSVTTDHRSPITDHPAPQPETT